MTSRGTHSKVDYLHKDPALVGYWKLDEMSGTFLDSSGNGHTGSALGNVKYNAQGVMGTAARFDGTEDRISITSTAALQLTNNFTIVAWVRKSTQDNNNHAIVAKRTGGSSYQLVYAAGGASNTISFICEGSTSTATTAITPKGVWTHVAATLDSSNNLKIYMNGVVDVDVAFLAATANGSALTIGSRGGVNFFPGEIDEVRIYTRALDPSDVYTLYRLRTYRPPYIPILPMRL